jgi:hypothetical protein
LAFNIQLSNLRRAARTLSELHGVSKPATWEWVKKLSERINVKPSKEFRRPITLDETM